MLELDLKLVAFDLCDRPVTEFCVKYALADGKVVAAFVAEADRRAARLDDALGCRGKIACRALPAGAARASAGRIGRREMGKGVALCRPVCLPQARASRHRRFVLYVIGGEFGDEAAWNAAGPLAIDPPVSRVKDGGFAAGPCDGDISQPAFLFERVEPALVERTLRGKYPFFPTNKKHLVEFETLGGVDGHDRNLGVVYSSFVVHDQADVLEEVTERFVFLHRARQFSEVFEAPARFDGLFGLKCGRIAALVEHGPREVSVRHRARHVAPARDVTDQIA